MLKLKGGFSTISRYRSPCHIITMKVEEKLEGWKNGRACALPTCAKISCACKCKCPPAMCASFLGPIGPACCTCCSWLQFHDQLLLAGLEGAGSNCCLWRFSPPAGSPAAKAADAARQREGGLAKAGARPASQAQGCPGIEEAPLQELRGPRPGQSSSGGKGGREKGKGGKRGQKRT